MLTRVGLIILCGSIPKIKKTECEQILDNSLAVTSWMPVFLVLLGFLVGGYGTMAGIGGGVVLLPVLLFIYPDANPGVLTSISLLVVAINASGGALAYARQCRIDYRNGLLFAVATIPATVLGVWVLSFLSVEPFSLIFGMVMLAVAAFMLFRPEFVQKEIESPRRGTACSITDSSGQTFEYTFNRPLGVVLSSGVGFIAGLLGIGGGVIHVPVMVYILRIPVHVAAATSHFILVFTAMAGVLSHLVLGNYASNWPVALWLALGVLPGSQFGAWLSRRLHSRMIVKLLALALVLLGVRMLLNAL